MRLPEFFKTSYFRKFRLLAIFFVALFSFFLVLLIIVVTRIPEPLESEKLAAKLVNPTTISDNGRTVYVPAAVEEITSEELNLLMLEKKSPKIIHIASADEWQGGHLEGSTFLTLESLSFAPDSLGQNEEIVLISKNGVDSVLAAQKLFDNFAFNRDKVRSLKGGLEAWKQKGFKVEK